MAEENVAARLGASGVPPVLGEVRSVVGVWGKSEGRAGEADEDVIFILVLGN